MGYFSQDLGKVVLEVQPFPSVAAEESALEAGQLDAAYLDPVAVVQAWQYSHGGIRVIAGAASGGSELVVRHGLTRAAQLKDHLLAAPAGSSEAADLDGWLGINGLPALTTAETTASTDAGVLAQFRAGRIAGGWEPAPLDTQMIGAGGHVLAGEASLWPGSSVAAAELVVTKRILQRDPAAVDGLLAGQIKSTAFLTSEPVSAAAALEQKLAALQGSGLPRAVLDASLAQVVFTVDPMETSVVDQARDAAGGRLIKPVRSLTGLFDVGPLNGVLRASGERPVGA
jgi:NitT/TauT family transport system substrate-binding protein